MEMDMSQNHQPPKLGWCEILKSAVFGGPIGTTFFSHAKIMFDSAKQTPDILEMCPISSDLQ
jgi:hypothetical protein